jgi:hypothetical protein
MMTRARYTSKFTQTARARLGFCVTMLGLTASAGLAQMLDMSPTLPQAEFRASTFTTSAQAGAALAAAPDGSFTVVWSSRRQQQGRYGVYLQRFDALGATLGSETPINLWAASHARAPSIGFSPDGSSWVAWQSSGQDGSANAVIARQFDAAGKGGSEILVNERTQGEQQSPVLAALPDGGAVVVWTTSLPGQPERVAMRVFNADASPRTDEMFVDDAAHIRTATPSVAVRSDGSFAVAFAAFADGGREVLGVRVRTFTADGAATGEANAVSAAGASSPVEPMIAATDAGFVIAWQDVLEDAFNYDVLARHLDARGRPVGQGIVVNTDRVGLQNAGAVAVAPDGSISIAFNGRDDNGRGVFVRDFTADLMPIGAQTRLTMRSQGNQEMRQAVGTQRLVFAPDATLLCAWQGDSGSGDGSAANVTMRGSSVVGLGMCMLGVTPEMQSAAFDDSAIALAAGPQPHEPPTFDKRDIDDAEREITHTRGAIGFTGVLSTGWTPPDPHMAVGPNHIVVMTNGNISFYTKDGTQTFTDEIENNFGFWGSVGATGFVFDPEVVYDETSGRFFAMASEAFAPNNRSYALIAVSDDSDPNGSWHKYRLSTTVHAGDLFDSPNIGVTENAVIVTGDGFGNGANYSVFIYDKASMLVGNPPVVTNSFVLATSTQSAGLPRVTTGTGDTLYLLEHREAISNNTAIRVLAITDLLTTPSVSSFNLTVPAYGSPEDPPQLGTTARPETFDARFWSVDQGPDGHLWGTHHIKPTRVIARWYEVDLQGWPTSGSNPSLVQSGDIDLGPDIRTFFSSINVSSNGNAAITYSRSSPSEFISMGSAWRRACDPAGTMPNDFIHKSANTGETSGRWGDYSAVQFDPTDANLYWAHHEYSVNSSWRTWVQSVATDSCDCPGDFNQDGMLDFFDVQAFLDAFSAEDPSADFTNDGVFNFFDVQAFLQAFSSGCP